MRIGDRRVAWAIISRQASSSPSSSRQGYCQGGPHELPALLDACPADGGARLSGIGTEPKTRFSRDFGDWPSCRSRVGQETFPAQCRLWLYADPCSIGDSSHSAASDSTASHSAASHRGTPNARGKGPKADGQSLLYFQLSILSFPRSRLPASRRKPETGSDPTQSAPGLGAGSGLPDRHSVRHL